MQSSNPFLALAQASSELQDPSGAALHNRRYRGPEEVLRDARERNSMYKAFFTNSSARLVPRAISMSRIQYGDGDFAWEVLELQRLKEPAPRPEPLPHMEEPVQLTRTLSRSLNHNTVRSARPAAAPQAPAEPSGGGSQPAPPALNKAVQEEAAIGRRNSVDASALSPLMRMASRRLVACPPGANITSSGGCATGADCTDTDGGDGAEPAPAAGRASADLRPEPLLRSSHSRPLSSLQTGGPAPEPGAAAEGYGALTTAVRRVLGPPSAAGASQSQDGPRNLRVVVAPPDADGVVGARSPAGAESPTWPAGGEGRASVRRRSSSSFSMLSRSLSTRTLQARHSHIEAPQDAALTGSVDEVLDELTNLTGKVARPPSVPPGSLPSRSYTLSRIGQRMVPPGGSAAIAASTGCATESGEVGHEVAPLRADSQISPSPVAGMDAGSMLSPTTSTDTPNSDGQILSPFSPPWLEAPSNGMLAGVQAAGVAVAANSSNTHSGRISSPRPAGPARALSGTVQVPTQATTSCAVVFKTGMPVRKQQPEVTTEQAARNAVLSGWSSRRRQSANNININVRLTTSGGSSLCESPSYSSQQAAPPLATQHSGFVRALLAARGSSSGLARRGSMDDGGGVARGNSVDDGRFGQRLSTTNGDGIPDGEYPARGSLDGGDHLLAVQRSSPSSPALFGAAGATGALARRFPLALIAGKRG